MNKYLRLAGVLMVCAYFWFYFATYTEGHVIDNVDLIFHEAGHVIFFFLGTFVQVAAGSAFQIAVALAISLYFFLSNQKISGALCLMWVGQNFLNVSVYTGDAITMQLELLGGDGVIHDWNYILNTLNILRHTDIIAKILYELGFMSLCLGTGLALYYVWKSTKTGTRADSTIGSQ